MVYDVLILQVYRLTYYTHEYRSGKPPLKLRFMYTQKLVTGNTHNSQNQLPVPTFLHF